MNKLIREKLKDSKTLLGPFPTFDLEELPDTPHNLFEDWFQSALDHKVHEPHAMVLSTVDKHGFPDSRVVILKDIDEHGWYFATSNVSKKGEQLKQNTNVSLCFYWSIIGRQIRICGRAQKMSNEQSSADFLVRGTVAKAIALLEKQSQILDNPTELDNALTEKLSELKDNPQLVSPAWTLYRVAAREIEFWQANKERKHIRVMYTLNGDSWKNNILWP